MPNTFKSDACTGSLKDKGGAMRPSVEQRKVLTEMGQGRRLRVREVRKPYVHDQCWVEDVADGRVRSETFRVLLERGWIYFSGYGSGRAIILDYRISPTGLAALK